MASILSSFNITRVLNVDNNIKQVALEGTIMNTETNEMERATAVIVKLPFTKDDLPSFFSESTVGEDNLNQGKFKDFVTTSVNTPNSRVKVSITCPANDFDVKKLIPAAPAMTVETPAMYETAHLPSLKFGISKLGWVDDILALKKETDNVLLIDPEYTLVLDQSWAKQIVKPLLPATPSLPFTTAQAAADFLASGAEFPEALTLSPVNVKTEGELAVAVSAADHFTADNSSLSQYLSHSGAAVTRATIRAEDNPYCGGPEVGTMHATAFVKDPSLMSLRDLTAEHIPLLTKMVNDCKARLATLFRVAPEHIQALVHYPPSFSRLHVHFKSLTTTTPDQQPGRSHILEGVINNLTLLPDYYQRASIPVKFPSSHPLMGSLLAARAPEDVLYIAPLDGPIREAQLESEAAKAAAAVENSAQ